MDEICSPPQAARVTGGHVGGTLPVMELGQRLAFFLFGNWRQTHVTSELMRVAEVRPGLRTHYIFVRAYNTCSFDVKMLKTCLTGHEHINELLKLVNNNMLMKKNFLKFIEQFHILTRISKIDNSFLYEKLYEAILQDLKQATILLKVTKTLSTQWNDLLLTLIKYYRKLHPNQSKGIIFATMQIQSKQART